MVIDLTSSEKSTFFRFLSLYLGSSFIFMLFVAFLYYQNEKTMYVDLAKSNAQNITSKASNEIIMAHMMGKKFDKEKYLNSKDYKISFYDSSKKIVFGNFNEDVDFNEKFLLDDNSITLVDNSTVGHLGIDFIVLKDTSLKEKIKNLNISIGLIFIFSYLFICVIGVYLAKLFLKPIKDEREKLNNFIKDTTHELNTPISAILMSLENENLTSKQIERVKISAKRISEIYKDLTYLFLEDKGKNQICEKIDLSNIIKAQLESFEPLYTKKKIELDTKLDNLTFAINRDDFVRLFNNLFSNAIKYNKISGKIEVILKNRTLVIKDTGIGIPKDKIDDIYKRYFRATNQSGGFGLGLNIVQSICETYNIKIEVDSIENEGTTFKLTF